MSRITRRPECTRRRPIGPLGKTLVLCARKPESNFGWRAAGGVESPTRVPAATSVPPLRASRACARRRCVELVVRRVRGWKSGAPEACAVFPSTNHTACTPRECSPDVEVRDHLAFPASRCRRVEARGLAFTGSSDTRPHESLPRQRVGPNFRWELGLHHHARISDR